MKIAERVIGDEHERIIHFLKVHPYLVHCLLTNAHEGRRGVTTSQAVEYW